MLKTLGILTLIFGLAASATARATDYRIDTWADGLAQPWSLAFLPDGRALVTELRGTLRIIAADGEVGPLLANVPPVYFAAQGGLLDVVLDPRFAARNRRRDRQPLEDAHDPTVPDEVLDTNRLVLGQ